MISFSDFLVVESRVVRIFSRLTSFLIAHYFISFVLSSQIVCTGFRFTKRTKVVSSHDLYRILGNYDN